MSPSANNCSASSRASACGEGTYLSRTSRTADSGWAPLNPSTGCPSLITITVGNDFTPNCCASICCSSALTLANKKAPLYSVASFSSIGINCLQGSHHSAQKSTTTGRLNDSSISNCWAFPSSISTILAVSFIGGFSPASKHPACYNDPPFDRLASTPRALHRVQTHFANSPCE